MASFDCHAFSALNRQLTLLSTPNSQTETQAPILKYWFKLKNLYVIIHFVGNS